MKVDLSSRWGSQLGRRQGPGIPFLVYEPRPRHLCEVLAAGLRWGPREHLVQGDERWTFAQVAGASTAVAALLCEAGAGVGDRVLLLGNNSVAWVLAFWGTVRSGATVVLGNPWWSPAEVQHAIDVVEPSAVLADDPGAISSTGVPTFGLHDLMGVELGEPSGPADVEHGDADDAAGEDAPAVILFTSGSTGLPKATVLSHRSCIAVQHALLHRTRRLPQDLGDDYPRGVNLQTGPLFHIGGVQGLLRAWLLGATLVMPRGRFDPAEVVDLIERERVERWGAVPTMARRVLDVPGLAERDLSSLRSLTLGGAAVPAELVERVGATFVNVASGITQIYGLTEAGGTLAMASGREQAAHPGAVGRPLDVVELRIEGAGDDGVGEILARSPGQMDGYWHDADSPIDAEGWIRTGDLGRIDADGYLHVTGRSRDVIIRGGENVAAANVERHLGLHPAVRDVAVVGLPDDDLGEIVAAVVRTDPDAPVTEAELRDHARRYLGYYEVPARWWLRTTELPVNGVGKVDKPALVRAFPTATTPAAPTRVATR